MAHRIKPGPDQESVWDYPRPPRLESTEKVITVQFTGVLIADTMRAARVLETSHPPVYYIPPADIRMEFLHDRRRTLLLRMERPRRVLLPPARRPRGAGRRVVLRGPDASVRRASRSLAFYPSRVDTCTIDGERVAAQEGDFYGGWITKNIVGPLQGRSRNVGLVTSVSQMPTPARATTAC